MIRAGIQHVLYMYYMATTIWLPIDQCRVDPARFFAPNIALQDHSAVLLVNMCVDTGCPTKHDSWKIVWNVVKHTMY